MTTIAFDGRTLAADTLTTDNWGLKGYTCKILLGNNFVAGGSGSLSQILKWFDNAKNTSDIIEYGYPDYEKDENGPSFLLVTNGQLYTHIEGLFLPNARPYHAVGSGRDYALAAMYCGKTAEEAVHIAMKFDNGTGGSVDTWSLS